MANNYVDRINIYDRGLNYLYQLHGPDHISPKLKVVRNKLVLFEKRSVETYWHSWYTEEYMYFLYNSSNKKENRTQPIDPTNRNGHLYGPMELFKLNWDGDLIVRYELDRFLYEISIDCKEQYLYGSHWKKWGKEYPQMVRYAL